MTPPKSRASRPRAGAKPVPDRGREAWALVVQMVKAARGRYLAELDLTPAQAQVLMHIDPDRPAQMSELAGALGCDASNVTGLVDRLEARQFLERRPDARDRRVKMVAVTRAGSRIQDRLHERWFEPPAPIAALSARDKATLLAILTRAARSCTGEGVG